MATTAEKRDYVLDQPYTGPFTAGPLYPRVIYVDTLDLYVAVSGDGYAATSSDGETWATQTTPNTNDWGSICWSPELSLLVAVGYSGTGDRVMTSPDGINWTSRSSSADSGWFGVCWSASKALFVAVALSGTNRIMTSPDGINWTNRTVGGNSQWNSVIWVETLGLFVAVGAASDITDEIMTSPDGINWTTQSGPDGDWSSIAWSESLGLLAVCSAQIGAPSVIITSPDGVTWSSLSVPAAAGVSYKQIIWIDELGMFISTNDIPDSTLLYSIDGTNWLLDEVGLTITSGSAIAYGTALQEILVMGGSQAYRSASASQAGSQVFAQTYDDTTTYLSLHVAVDSVPVTPSDDLLPKQFRGIRVTGAGTVTVSVQNGASRVLNFTDGETRWIYCFKVTEMTATGVEGLV